MRIFTFIILFSNLALNSSAQATIQNKFEFIYIDNSRSNNQEGFTDKLVERLRQNIEELKDTSINFIIYFSNNKEYSIYSTRAEATKVLDKIYAQATQYPYNQITEVKTIKEEVSSRIKEMNGKIEFNFYVSEKFVKLISEQPSYLANFFPHEIGALLRKNELINVNINFPIANNTVNLASTNAALGFMAHSTSVKLNYKITPY